MCWNEMLLCLFPDRASKAWGLNERVANCRRRLGCGAGLLSHALSHWAFLAVVVSAGNLMVHLRCSYLEWSRTLLRALEINIQLARHR